MLNKLLNKLTHYFLGRAYAQMQTADEQGTVSMHEDTVADFCDDYWSTFVSRDADDLNTD